MELWDFIAIFYLSVNTLFGLEEEPDFPEPCEDLFLNFELPADYDLLGIFIIKVNNL